MSFRFTFSRMFAALIVLSLALAPVASPVMAMPAASDHAAMANMPCCDDDAPAPKSPCAEKCRYMATCQTISFQALLPRTAAAYPPLRVAFVQPGEAATMRGLTRRPPPRPPKI